MIAWIMGDKENERWLADAVAGAFEKGIVLHGQEFIEEHKLAMGTDRSELLLHHRLAATAKILERQDCVVIIAHTGRQVLVQALRKFFVRSLPIVIDEPVHYSVKPPFICWVKGDRITDRDDLVESILRKIKEEGS